MSLTWLRGTRAASTGAAGPSFTLTEAALGGLKGGPHPRHEFASDYRHRKKPEQGDYHRLHEAHHSSKEEPAELKGQQGDDIGQPREPAKLEQRPFPASRLAFGHGDCGHAGRPDEQEEHH